VILNNEKSEQPLPFLQYTEVRKENISFWFSKIYG